MRRAHFRFGLHTGAKFTWRKLTVKSRPQAGSLLSPQAGGLCSVLRAIVPIVLGKVNRGVFAIGEESAPAWALWDYAQGHGLRSSQVCRRFIEINLTGRANTLNIPAIRRQIQISFQDILLRIMTLQLEGAHDLGEFSCEASGAKMKTQPGNLHGDGRSARRHAPPTHELERGTPQ